MLRVLTTVLIGCLLLAAPVQAGIILSNLPGTSSGSGTNLGLGTDGADRTKGVSLTMGAESLSFESMVALISNTTPASELSGGIYADSAGDPGTLLAPFTPVPIPASVTATLYTLTVPGGFMLNASTNYWFVLDGPTTTNSLMWNGLTPNTAPTPAAGITYNGYRWSSNGGTTWQASSTYNGLTINAVPEPATLALLGLGLGLLRRR